ncbi:MAG: hypothetical protein OCC49_00795 [Fibrobacterales bacterium]
MNSTYIRRLIDLGPARFVLPVFPLIILGILIVLLKDSDTGSVDPIGFLIFLIFALIMGGIPGALLLFDLYGRQKVKYINDSITVTKKIIGITLSSKKFSIKQFWGVAAKKSERSSTQKRGVNGKAETVTHYKTTYILKHGQSANSDLALLIESKKPDDALLNEISIDLSLPILNWSEIPSIQNVEPHSRYFPKSAFTQSSVSDTLILTNHHWRLIHRFFMAFATTFFLGALIAGPIGIVAGSLPLVALLYLKKYQLQLTLSPTSLTGHSLLSPLSNYKYSIPYRDILGVSVEGIETEKSANHVVLRITTRDTTTYTLPAGPRVFSPTRSALLFNRHDAEWLKAVIVSRMKNKWSNMPQLNKKPSISELFSEAT